jgi:hypothetical protein
MQLNPDQHLHTAVHHWPISYPGLRLSGGRYVTVRYIGWYSSGLARRDLIASIWGALRRVSVDGYGGVVVLFSKIIRVL